MAEDWDKKLVLAIWDSNLKSVEDALNNGANVNAEGEDRRTPLLNAIICNRNYSNKFEIFKILISRGANINRIYHFNPEKENTVLALCIRYGLNEYAEYLISLGANVCKVGKGGKTPLSWAVYKKNIEMVKLLLNHGAHFTIPTAFFEAIELNNLEIVKILISKGANVNLIDKNGFTPLTKTLKREANDVTLNIVKTLIAEGANVNFVDKNGYTPLTKALEVVGTDIIKELIGSGADMNILHPCGDHHLIKSIKLGRFDIAQLFAEKGANIDVPDGDNNFPLIISTYLGNLELVKTLIEKGANLKVTDKLGRSPFIIALQEDHFEIVKYFVQRGEDVNQKFDKEETPLAIAAANLNYQMFQFLVESGADVNLAKEKIQEIAAENENFDVFVRGLKKGNSMDETKSLGSNGTGQEDAL